MSCLTFWRAEEVSDDAAQWLGAQICSMTQQSPLLALLAWRGTSLEAVFSAFSGLCSCRGAVRPCGCSSPWGCWVHGSHPGAGSAFICYIAGTKAYSGDGNHWTWGTRPEQARRGKGLHSLSFVEEFCQTRAVRAWLWYVQMMDGCIREGRCLLLPLPFPILLEVWKVQVLSICLFAWKALWMLQQVHSLHPGISVSLFTQESLLLLPQGVHIFFKCDLCVLICDDKKMGLSGLSS